MRLFRRIRPHGLFGRALLMVALPPVLLAAVVGIAVPDRWREDVTERLLIRLGKTLSLIRSFDKPSGDKVADAFEFVLQRYPGAPPPLPPACRIPARPEAPASLIRSVLTRRVGEPLIICAPNDNNALWLVRLTRAPVIDVYVPGHYFINSKWHFVPVWTAVSAVITAGISLLFMKNQVRPIVRLAAAADAFGRGEDDVLYRPSGADEVRRAGTAFLKMRARLRRHMRERELFSVGVGHDLRTMLTRLRLALSLLPDDAAHRALGEDLQLMGRMVDSFLDFARSTERETAATLHPAAAIRDVSARYPQATFEDRLPETFTVPLRVDSFKRTLHNLLDNALRFGTQAHILSEPDEGGGLRVSVRDNGPGIPETERASLWQPFVRRDPARTLGSGSGPGLGLGLALVKEAMHAQGGSAAFAPDDPDRPGLTVLLRFPPETRSPPP